jgi:hypothetical protein
MTEKHLRKLQGTEKVPLDDERAVIHYTRAYDILNRNDREELECILLTLAYLADDKSQL